MEHFGKNIIHYISSKLKHCKSKCKNIIQHIIIFILPSQIKTKINLFYGSKKRNRKLEIGPGQKRIPGFETLNIVDDPVVDYICDASKTLPFRDNTFDIIYASHILEHIPWYQTESTIHEWVRILKPNGYLEIWVPDGLKICQAFVDAEKGQFGVIAEDGWYRFNPEKDPCKWASGRIFTYGEGTGVLNHPNWHRAIFSSRFLIKVFQASGLTDISIMGSDEIRGYDHKWINLGVKGKKSNI